MKHVFLTRMAMYNMIFMDFVLSLDYYCKTHCCMGGGVFSESCWDITKQTNRDINLVKPIKMHYAVSGVVLQQEAHV